MAADDEELPTEPEGIIVHVIKTYIKSNVTSNISSSSNDKISLQKSNDSSAESVSLDTGANSARASENNNDDVEEEELTNSPNIDRNSASELSNRSQESNSNLDNSSHSSVDSTPGTDFSSTTSPPSDALPTERIDTGIVLEYDFMVPSLEESESKTTNDSLETKSEDSSVTPPPATSNVTENIKTNLSFHDNKISDEGISITSEKPAIHEAKLSADKDADFSSRENMIDDTYDEYDYDPLDDEYTSLYDEYEYDDYVDGEQLKEDRPDGIAEDKIDIDGFEIVELVQVPIKGRKHRRHRDRSRGNRHNRNKKKKRRQKVVVHEGEAAIAILNEIIQDNVKRKPAENIRADTIVPVYSWNVGNWNEVRLLVMITKFIKNLRIGPLMYQALK